MHICVHCGVRSTGDDWRCAGCGFDPQTAGGIPLLAPDLAGANRDDATYLQGELAAAELRHFWFVARSRLINAAIRRHFARAGSFLDLGCGTGGVLAAIDRQRPDLDLAACDVRLSGLDIVKQRVPRAAVVQADIRSLPYESHFDVIGVFDVLEHLDDDEAVLREIRRAVRPGGGAIITVPQHPSLWSAVDEFSRHRRRYTRAGLVDAVLRAGFSVEQVTSFMTFVLPVLMLSRMCTQDAAALNPAAELRIGAGANALLRSLCRLEGATIALGCSWPAGGSLLLIARRP
jgi:SAM-dependent methyltransferase